MIPLDLLFEVPLTVVAWKRGWRGWALLPMAVAYALTFVLGIIEGLSVAATGTDLEPLSSASVVLITIVECGVLIAMIVRARKHGIPDTRTRSSHVEQPRQYCTRCGTEQYGNPMFCRECGEMIGEGRTVARA